MEITQNSGSALARLNGLTSPLVMEPHDQPPPGDITNLLRVWNDGDERAFERLIPLVYDELHRMALRYLGGERSNVSLQATGLVNEVCLRLLGWDQVRWQNRGHFFGVSAQMMRRVLVDIARRRQAERRGGAAVVHVPLDRIDVACNEPDAEVVAVDDALERLAAHDPRKARVVELRFFGGLSMDETAQALGVSPRTVQNDWAFARAWLYRELTGK
jgi:RNA polymerase sigma-70 factor (ECF subfamily)